MSEEYFLQDRLNITATWQKLKGMMPVLVVNWAQVFSKTARSACSKAPPTRVAAILDCANQRASFLGSLICAILMSMPSWYKGVYIWARSCIKSSAERTSNVRRWNLWLTGVNVWRLKLRRTLCLLQLAPSSYHFSNSFSAFTTWKYEYIIYFTPMLCLLFLS